MTFSTEDTKDLEKSLSTHSPTEMLKVWSITIVVSGITYFYYDAISNFIYTTWDDCSELRENLTNFRLVL